jgi:hypothetical protein
LKDLLISGKSGTMLPITACSSTGQFCHEGIVNMAAADRVAPRLAVPFERHEDFAAPALDPASAASRLRRQRSAARLALAELRKQQAQQAQRLVDLVEADGHPRGDVAIACVAILTAEPVIGWPGVIAAQIGGLAAGTTGKAGQAEASGQLRRHPAGGHEAILQAGMLVIDPAQFVHLTCR